MSAIYTVIGATFFWLVALCVIFVCAFVAFSLWRNRERIRWPWEQRVAGAEQQSNGGQD